MEKIISLKMAADMNEIHRDMPQRIRQAHPDSEALQEVAMAQYVRVIDELLTTLEKLSGIQERTVELAFANEPMQELDELKKEIGL